MGSADEGGGRSTGGGRTSRGPAIQPGGETEPGGLVPPYDGRKESAEIEDAPLERDGANIGGAVNPRLAPDELKSPDPASTPGGQHATPSDEQPATPGGAPAPDPGVGPAHTSGTPRGEDSGA